MEFGEFTHSFTGVFTVDVLIAWALVGLGCWCANRWWRCCRRPGRGGSAALPALRCAARPRAARSLALWWYVSAVLGALTHVVWDAFTHLDRWGMRVFPVLGAGDGGLPSVLVCAVRRFGGRRGRDRRVRGWSPCGGSRRAEPVGVPALSVRDRWLRPVP